MRRADEETVTMSMMAYLMGAEAWLDSHSLDLEGIAEFTGWSFVIGSGFVERMGTMKRVSRSDRDKTLAYMCIALPASLDNPSGLEGARFR